MSKHIKVTVVQSTEVIDFAAWLEQYAAAIVAAQDEKKRSRPEAA